MLKAREEGIINVEELMWAYKHMTEKMLKKNYEAKCTVNSSGQEQWYISYKDHNGSFKQVRSKNEAEVWKKLAVKLADCDQKSKRTLADMCVEAIREKEETFTRLNKCIGTIVRNEQDYRRFFAGEALCQKPIAKISKKELSQLCDEVIVKHQLKRQAWINAKTILNLAYDYAVEQELVDDNLARKVKISVAYAQDDTDEEKVARGVFTETEQCEFLDFVEKEYAETGNPAALVAKLQYQTGMRVGEVVALEKKYRYGNSITIKHMERKNKRTNQYVIVNHTKNHKSRTIILSESALETLNRLDIISGRSEYYATRDGERMDATDISYIYKKFAQKLGRRTKYTHTSRRTFASNALKAGVEIPALASYLGDRKETIINNYCYDITPKEETIAKISAAQRRVELLEK